MRHIRQKRSFPLGLLPDNFLVSPFTLHCDVVMIHKSLFLAEKLFGYITSRDQKSTIDLVDPVNSSYNIPFIICRSNTMSGHWTKLKARLGSSTITSSIIYSWTAHYIRFLTKATKVFRCTLSQVSFSCKRTLSCYNKTCNFACCSRREMSLIFDLKHCFLYS